MESRIATGAELGEENDGEEWLAYIVNAYLCFKDFDSYEKPAKIDSTSKPATATHSRSKESMESDPKSDKMTPQNQANIDNLVQDEQPGDESVRKTLEPIFDDDSLMQTKASETQAKTTKRRTKSERKRQYSRSQERPNQIQPEPMNIAASQLKANPKEEIATPLAAK